MIEEFMQSESRVPLPIVDRYQYIRHVIDNPPPLDFDHLTKEDETQYYAQVCTHETQAYAIMLDNGHCPPAAPTLPESLWPGKRINYVFWAYCEKTKEFFYWTREYFQP